MAARIEGEPWVLPAILGARDDIGRWVGTLTEPLDNVPNSEHVIALCENHERGYVMGGVQLFAKSGSPCYGVILGRLRQ